MSRLHAAYYERFPGCWHQADFVAATRHDGYIVHGRSDTTLNANGVRIGTSEIYTQLENLEWVRGAVAIEHKLESTGQVVLLVELSDSLILDDRQRNEIRTMLRERCSPRHVPAVIEQVADLPRTKNGKLSEVATADAINLREVRWAETLANPASLVAIRRLGAQLNTR